MYFITPPTPTHEYTEEQRRLRAHERLTSEPVEASLIVEIYPTYTEARTIWTGRRGCYVILGYDAREAITTMRRQLELRKIAEKGDPRIIDWRTRPPLTHPYVLVEYKNCWQASYHGNGMHEPLIIRAATQEQATEGITRQAALRHHMLGRLTLIHAPQDLAPLL
jgi:hypothetical protein